MAAPATVNGEPRSNKATGAYALGRPSECDDPRARKPAGSCVTLPLTGVCHWRGKTVSVTLRCCRDGSKAIFPIRIILICCFFAAEYLRLSALGFRPDKWKAALRLRRRCWGRTMYKNAKRTFKLFFSLGTAIATTHGIAQAQSSVNSPDAKRLEKVVVSASRIPVPASRVGSSVSVLYGEELEQRGDQYVSDILRDVPGLAVSRSGSFGALTQVRMRGTEANHVLVVIDGIEVNDQSSGSEFDFGRLLLSDIERIEILRGSQSALWGSDAIGGVINIITKSGDGPVNGFASAETGSFRTGKVDAAIRGGNEIISGSLSVSEYTTDGISQADEDAGNGEEDGVDITTVNAKISITPTKDLTVDLVGRYNRSFLQTDAFFGGVGATDAATHSETHQRYGLIGVNYSMLDGKWTHLLRAAYAEDDDKSLGSFGNSAADGTKRKFDYQTTYRFQTYETGETDHAVTLLIEEETDRMTASFVPNTLETENRAAAVEYNLSLWNQLHLSGSTRRDDNDRFADKTTYRATAAYELSDWKGRLHTSYGTGVKNPTLTELFGFSSTFVGNPNLKPEQSKSWDIGYEQQFLDGLIEADITYFNNKVTDLIVGAGNSAINLDGKSPAEGIEVSAEYYPTADLTLSASYTYTNAETSDGTEQVRRARHVASMNVNYAFMEGKANANLGIDFNGDQTDFAFDSSFNRSIVKLDSYVLVNLHASYDVRHNVRLFIRGENLLDENYQEISTYGTPGISGYAGVKVSF